MAARALLLGLLLVDPSGGQVAPLPGDQLADSGSYAWTDEDSLFWDDDGDCFCEEEPCEGSSSSSCGSLQGGDCMDNPADARSEGANPRADEDCTDVVDNDCDGLVNDGCTDVTRFATVQGGGCSAAPSSLGLWALGLAGLLALLRRRSGVA